MPTFQAGVQYGDWKGTAAADEFGDARRDLEDLFQAKGKVDIENDILIAFEFFIGENDFFYLMGFFHPKSESTADGWIPSLNHDFDENTDPIRVKQVKVDISLSEFLAFLKRFSVVLVRQGLDISGREYVVIEESEG